MLLHDNTVAADDGIGLVWEAGRVVFEVLEGSRVLRRVEVRSWREFLVRPEAYR